jgi:hypothetical protein
MAADDAEHVAFAGAPERHLDLAHAVDAVAGNPSTFGRSVSAGAAAAGSRGAKGTPATMARSIIRVAIVGSVAKVTSSGTCAAARRSEAPARLLAR